ncbi:unnamed protein product, partial [Rotaria sp. Silwood2]
MNTTDLKYLSKTAGSMEEKITQKGRPPNERFLFPKQHPQVTTYLMMKYKDRDDHLLQVIVEAQVDNDSVDPVLIPPYEEVDDEYGMDDNDDLLELLGNLDENTVAMFNATKNSTENKYTEEIIEAVKNVGRFNSVTTYDQYSFNEFNDRIDQSLVPFISTTPNLVQLNTKWQEQLTTEKEQIRR